MTRSSCNPFTRPANGQAKPLLARSNPAPPHHSPGDGSAGSPSFNPVAEQVCERARARYREARDERRVRSDLYSPGDVMGVPTREPW